MRYLHSVSVALAILGLTAGPAVGLPRLSLHEATVSPVSSPLPTPDPVGALRFALFGLVGGIQVKDTSAIAAKFKARAGAASQDYAQGVANAGPAWEAGARAGEDNWAAGVQDAIGRKAFGKGVSAAGSSKYTDNASKLGTQRYPTGVANAEGAYAKGVGPFLDVVKSINLPARGPKGSAQNQQRAQVVAAAMRAKKVGG